MIPVGFATGERLPPNIKRVISKLLQFDTHQARKIRDSLRGNDLHVSTCMNSNIKLRLYFSLVQVLAFSTTPHHTLPPHQHAPSHLVRTSRPRNRIIEAHALPLRNILTIGITQQLPNLHALMSLDPRNLRARVVGQAPAHLHRLALPHLAVRPGTSSTLINHAQAYSFLLGKKPFDVHHADGQKPGFAEQRLVGALVDVQRAVRAEAVQDPEVAVADGRGGGEEARMEGDLAAVDGGSRGLLGAWSRSAWGGGTGAGAGTRTVVEGGQRGGGRVVDLRGQGGGGAAGLDVLGDLVDVAGVGGAGDDGGDAGGGGEAGGYDLGGHAACAQGGAGLGDVGNESANVFDNLDRLGVRVGSGVLIIKTVDVGHEEEQISVDHGGGDGGQSVVVTKLDFGYGQRIVLIDDGDHAHVEQLMHSVLRIEVS